MKPLIRKIFLPAPLKALTNSCVVPAVSPQRQGRLAMGTSRAGPGWAHWLFSDHSLQPAMESPECFRQHCEEEGKKPEPMLFLHTGEVLSSFGETLACHQPESR